MGTSSKPNSNSKLMQPINRGSCPSLCTHLVFLKFKTQTARNIHLPSEKNQKQQSYIKQESTISISGGRTIQSSAVDSATFEIERLCPRIIQIMRRSNQRNIAFNLQIVPIHNINTKIICYSIFCLIYFRLEICIYTSINNYSIHSFLY